MSSKDRAWFTEKEFEVVAALRQALAQSEQKEWVGLTDEESTELLQKAAKHKSPDYCTAPEMAVEFGRLASEVLREKNT